MTRLMFPAFLLMSFAIIVAACSGGGPQTFEEACHYDEAHKEDEPLPMIQDATFKAPNGSKPHEGH